MKYYPLEAYPLDFQRQTSSVDIWGVSLNAQANARAYQRPKMIRSVGSVHKAAPRCKERGTGRNSIGTTQYKVLELPYLAALFPLTHNSLFPIIYSQKGEFYQLSYNRIRQYQSSGSTATGGYSAALGVWAGMGRAPFPGSTAQAREPKCSGIRVTMISNNSDSYFMWGEIWTQSLTERNFY